MNKTTKEELIEKQSWPLYKKIEYSKNKILEFLLYSDEKCFVAFSGGIDSTVLLHLCRSIKPDILAVFSNTTNEYPELVKFVKSIDNVKIIYPNMKFREVVKNYGFPFVSKKVSRGITDLKEKKSSKIATRNLILTGINKKGKIVKSWKLGKKWLFLADENKTKFNITSKCCDILKKEPMKKFKKESGLYSIVGTTADESSDRELNYIKFGCNIYNDSDPKSRPLSIWTKKDIWDYVKIYNVNYCSLYDDLILPNGEISKGMNRTGCAACGMGCSLEENDRFKILKERNPKYYENVMKIKNNDITFEEAFRHTFIKNKWNNKEYQEKLYDKLNNEIKLDIQHINEVKNFNHNFMIQILNE